MCAKVSIFGEKWRVKGEKSKLPTIQMTGKTDFSPFTLHFSLFTKKAEVRTSAFLYPQRQTVYLPWCSLDTLSDLRPFLRRAERTRRPLAVSIRWRKPCLFTLFLLWGWNVLFIVLSYFLFINLSFHFTLWVTPKSQFLHHRCRNIRRKRLQN